MAWIPDTSYVMYKNKTTSTLSCCYVMILAIPLLILFKSGANYAYVRPAKFRFLDQTESPLCGSLIWSAASGPGAFKRRCHCLIRQGRAERVQFTLDDSPDKTSLSRVGGGAERRPPPVRRRSKNAVLRPYLKV